MFMILMFIAKKLIDQESSNNGEVQSCYYNMELVLATTELEKSEIPSSLFLLYLKQRCEDRSLDCGRHQKVVYYSVVSRGI